MPLDPRTGFGYFFLAGGLLGLAGGAEQIVKQIALWRRAICVGAKVLSVRVETRIDENGHETTEHLPTVSFSAGDELVRTEVVRGRFRSKTFHKGQTLEVFYDPRDPRRAVLRRRDWPGGFTVTILAGASAAVGVALLWL